MPIFHCIWWAPVLWVMDDQTQGRTVTEAGARHRDAAPSTGGSWPHCPAGHRLGWPVGGLEQCLEGVGTVGVFWVSTCSHSVGDSQRWGNQAPTLGNQQHLPSPSTMSKLSAQPSTMFRPGVCVGSHVLGNWKWLCRCPCCA